MASRSFSGIAIRQQLTQSPVTGTWACSSLSVRELHFFQWFLKSNIRTPRLGLPPYTDAKRFLWYRGHYSTSLETNALRSITVNRGSAIHRP